MNISQQQKPVPNFHKQQIPSSSHNSNMKENNCLVYEQDCAFFAMPCSTNSKDTVRLLNNEKGSKIEHEIELGKKKKIKHNNTNLQENQSSYKHKNLDDKQRVNSCNNIRSSKKVVTFIDFDMQSSQNIQDSSVNQQSISIDGNSLNKSVSVLCEPTQNSIAEGKNEQQNNQSLKQNERQGHNNLQNSCENNNIFSFSHLIQVQNNKKSSSKSINKTSVSNNNSQNKSCLKKIVRNSNPVHENPPQQIAFNFNININLKQIPQKPSVNNNPHIFVPHQPKTQQNRLSFSYVNPFPQPQPLKQQHHQQRQVNFFYNESPDNYLHQSYFKHINTQQKEKQQCQTTIKLLDMNDSAYQKRFQTIQSFVQLQKEDINLSQKKINELTNGISNQGQKYGRYSQKYKEYMNKKLQLGEKNHHDNQNMYFQQDQTSIKIVSPTSQSRDNENIFLQITEPQKTYDLVKTSICSLVVNQGSQKQIDHAKIIYEEEGRQQSQRQTERSIVVQHNGSKNIQEKEKDRDNMIFLSMLTNLNIQVSQLHRQQTALIEEQKSLLTEKSTQYSRLLEQLNSEIQQLQKLKKASQQRQTEIYTLKSKLKENASKNSYHASEITTTVTIRPTKRNNSSNFPNASRFETIIKSHINQFDNKQVESEEETSK